jgi:hypothetical protein
MESDYFLDMNWSKRDAINSYRFKDRFFISLVAHCVGNVRNREKMRKDSVLRFATMTTMEAVPIGDKHANLYFPSCAISTTDIFVFGTLVLDDSQLRKRAGASSDFAPLSLGPLAYNWPQSDKKSSDITSGIRNEGVKEIPR